LDLARRCDGHETHSRHVCTLTLALFDQLKRLHELGEAERELIEYGALLHDIGWHISKDAHHKHSQYLILHGDLRGFSREEVGIIANIARYHRKSLPKPSHEAFEALQGRAKRIVRVGAALLRIADGLDRSHASVVSEVTAKVGKDGVELVIKGKGDTELEAWGARRKSDFFEQVFDRRVEIVRVGR
jgi:exopolyphosphatase / guanosine-5'-triphosphate,3'-diphosphate pyrophosphatase